MASDQLDDCLAVSYIHAFLSPMSCWKKFRIGTSLAELTVVRASRMKIIHVVTVINTTFPVTDKVIYTYIYYYLMENRPNI